MYRIAVCRSTEEQLSPLCDFIGKLYPNASYGFTKLSLLEETLNDRKCTPDIAIIDVDFDNYSGIVCAKTLRKINRSVKIIFISDNIEHAVDVYYVEHFWFITENRIKECLPTILKKAFHCIKEEEKETCIVPIKMKDGIARIHLMDVLYMERQGRFTNIVFGNQSIITKKHPDELISEQISDNFIHCHQSYWVNVKRVQKMITDAFILDGNHSIPISRTYRELSRKKFLNI